MRECIWMCFVDERGVLIIGVGMIGNKGDLRAWLCP